MAAEICERTFDFAKRIVLLYRKADRRNDGSRTLYRQLLRSGTSVGANVEEAQGGQSRADFLSKMQIACKEARETHYWLRLLVATDLAASDDVNDLLVETNEIVAVLTTIVRKTKENTEKTGKAK